MRNIGTNLGYVKSMEGAMKTLSGPSEPVEKERIRLQINAQVEEFLRRGGAIEVVTNYSRSTAATSGSVGDDDDEYTTYLD